jgi:phospholipase C
MEEMIISIPNLGGYNRNLIIFIKQRNRRKILLTCGFFLITTEHEQKRIFRKSSILLAGLGTSSVLHPAILKALAIDPAAQSTFYDAEHVVILMQENRSFDHALELKGVRGFWIKGAFVNRMAILPFSKRIPENMLLLPVWI